MPRLIWDFFRSTVQVIRRAPSALGSSRNCGPKQHDERRDRARLPANEQGSVKWLNSGGSRQELKINIRDVSDAGLGISLVQLLRVGQTVWISTASNTKCKGVVRYCREETGGYFAGVIRVLRERRRADRQPAGGKGKLHWEAPGGGQREADALVRDANGNGVQVHVSDQVPVPAVVRLEGHESDCFGSTCYCAAYQDGYLVGMHVIRRVEAGEVEQFII